MSSVQNGGLEGRWTFNAQLCPTTPTHEAFHPPKPNVHKISETISGVDRFASFATTSEYRTHILKSDNDLKLYTENISCKLTAIKCQRNLAQTNKNKRAKPLQRNAPSQNYTRNAIPMHCASGGCCPTEALLREK